MPSPLTDSLALAAEWYRWGVAAGLATTVVITFWIFFDSQRWGYRATFWRTLSLLAALVVTPSAVMSMSPHFVAAFSDLAVLLALLGVLASVLSLISLLLYTAGLGVTVVQDAEGAEASEDLDFDPLPPLEQPAVAVSGAPSPPRPQTHPPTPPAMVSTAQLVDTQTLELEIADEIPDRTYVLPPADGRQTPLAWLVVLSGEQEGREYRLGQLTDLGRDPSCNDICVKDPAISRQHARVRLEKEGFVLYDLASANGVSLNGEVIQRHALRNGDRIVIGQLELGFMVINEEP